MNPAQIKLCLFKKEGKDITFRLLDAKTREGVDLTGKTVRLTVREDIDTAVLFTLSTGSGIVHADQVPTATRGQFVATFTTVQTDLNVTEHIWDLWVDDEVYVSPSPLIVELSVRQP